MSLLKDIGLLYKDAWSIRKDLKEDIRNDSDYQIRLAGRLFVAAWWFMFLFVHAVIVFIPSAIVFAIAGLMGAYG